MESYIQRSVFYPEEKLALFIDGANLYSAAKALDFEIDYKKLLIWASKQGRLVRAFYYTAISDDQEYSPVRPLVDWLDYNGYTMVTKQIKEFTDINGRKKLKSNMDVDLAVDAMEMADNIDHMMLFSGDSDFRKLIKSVQRKGVKVSVVSTISSPTPMVADELRRQADYFVDLQQLTEHIARTDNFDSRDNTNLSNNPSGSRNYYSDEIDEDDFQPEFLKV